MTEAILLLLVIGAGIGAYLKARQEAAWSWPLFAKAVLCLLAIGGSLGTLGVWIGRFAGPEHALITTIGVVTLIVSGVLVLTIWMGRKRGPGGE